MNKKSVIIRILVSLVFFISGILIYFKLINLLIVDRPGVKYISTSLAGLRPHSFYFGVCLAFIPMCSILLQLSKLKNILISGVTISVFLVAGIFAKRILLAFKIDNDLKKYKDGIELLTVEASPIGYMFIALIIGFIFLLYLKAKGILFRNDSPHSGNDLLSLFFK